jgi:branched-chain amino acid transport system ATP-binding protein
VAGATGLTACAGCVSTTDGGNDASGVSDDSLDSVIDELYERFPILAKKRTVKAHTHSGGERQVLSFARALVMEPDVLLINDSSAGHALNTADEVFGDVVAVNEMNTAILMVEQNVTKGVKIADHGSVLDQGRVRFEGTAEELLDDDDEVSRLYLDDGA